MDAVSNRSIATVACLQAATAIAALLFSPTAALAVAAIGALALGRYVAVALFARAIGSGGKALMRFLAVSAWVLGFAALLAAVAAVALKAKGSLPWAVAAAFAGPLGMSALAFGSGISALAASRPRLQRNAPGGAGHSGGDR
jgi:hypothetical protein